MNEPGPDAKSKTQSQILVAMSGVGAGADISENKMVAPSTRIFGVAGLCTSWIFDGGNGKELSSRLTHFLQA